jgi:hypothetical protein
MWGGEKKIDIPANVPVVALAPATAADIALVPSCLCRPNVNRTAPCTLVSFFSARTARSRRCKTLRIEQSASPATRIAAE